LEWLENDHGADVIRKINQALKGCRYDAGTLWHNCCGKSIKELWQEYTASLKNNDKQSLDTPEEKSNESQKAGNEETEEEHKQEEHVAPAHDERTAHQKARRGGNMIVPVRPGAA
jgi:hypothetical protein